MKIKFHETLYDLYTSPDVGTDHMSVCLYKGENTIDYIVEDSKFIDDIYVYEDDGETLHSIISGFTNRVAVTVMDGYDYICIEYKGPSLEEKVAALEAQLNTKADSSILSENTEEIGQPSKNSYAVGNTFTANGFYYKAVAVITAGNILVENGNCELTTIDDKINSNKEEE